MLPTGHSSGQYLLPGTTAWPRRWTTWLRSAHLRLTGAEYECWLLLLQTGRGTKAAAHIPLCGVRAVLPLPAQTLYRRSYGAILWAAAVPSRAADQD
jgi:hypothetical protein